MSRCETCGQPLPALDGVHFDRDRHTVTTENGNAKLQPNESEMFACLLGRHPRLQRDVDIWDWVYDGGVKGDPDLKIITVYACRMRKRLTPIGVYIVTHWGKGFSLSTDPEDEKGQFCVNKWSPEDDQRLLSLKMQNATWTEIERTLGRGEGTAWYRYKKITKAVA